MFRDQSQDVIQKAKNTTTTKLAPGCATPRRSKKARSGASRTAFHSGDSCSSSCEDGSSLCTDGSSLVDTSTTSSLDGDSSPDEWAVMQPLPPLCITLTQPSPPREEGICFFMRGGFSRLFSWTEEDQKIDRFRGAPGSIGHQAMLASMGSVGMAMLASQRRSSTIKAAAINEFGSALTLVNSALSDKPTALTNFTLAAVLSLGICEVRSSLPFL